MENKTRELYLANEKLEQQFDKLKIKATETEIFQLGISLERRQAEEEAEQNYTKLQQALVELRRLANYDWLTNLPNRLNFQNVLKREIAKKSKKNRKDNSSLS